jgi:hypothetical protein
MRRYGSGNLSPKGSPEIPVVGESVRLQARAHRGVSIDPSRNAVGDARGCHRAPALSMVLPDFGYGSGTPVFERGSRQWWSPSLWARLSSMVVS